MNFSNKNIFASLVLVSLTFVGNTAHAQESADLWGDLSLASCEQQTTTDGNYSVLYCKGAPQATSISVIDHQSVSYSAAELAQTQCHVSITGATVVCFNSDSVGLEIPNTLLAPAANSCQQLQWNESLGELLLRSSGCTSSYRTQSISGSITLADFLVAAQTWENPEVKNDNGEVIIEDVGYGDEVDNLIFNTPSKASAYGPQISNAGYGDEVDDNAKTIAP